MPMLWKFDSYTVIRSHIAAHLGISNYNPPLKLRKTLINIEMEEGIKEDLN